MVSYQESIGQCSPKGGDAKYKILKNNQLLGEELDYIMILCLSRRHKDLWKIFENLINKSAIMRDFRVFFEKGPTMNSKTDKFPKFLLKS